MRAWEPPEHWPLRPAAQSLSIPPLKKKRSFCSAAPSISTALRKHLLHRKKNKAAGVCRAKQYPAVERGQGQHWGGERGWGRRRTKVVGVGTEGRGRTGSDGAKARGMKSTEGN